MHHQDFVTSWADVSSSAVLVYQDPLLILQKPAWLKVLLYVPCAADVELNRSSQPSTPPVCPPYELQQRDLRMSSKVYSLINPG